MTTTEKKTRKPILEGPFDDENGRKFYRGRVWLADGSKARVNIPEHRRYKEESARLHLDYAQEVEDETHAIFNARQGARATAATAVVSPAVDAEAADRWFDAWEASRIAKGLTSTRDNRGHWREHIKPAIDGKHVRDWTTDDARAIVRYLDGKVRDGAMEWKTAIHVWTTATKMCADAVSSKVDALRVRTDDPTANVEGPDRGEEKSKPFLYPSEFLAFVSSPVVPTQWKIAVTLAIYLYPRDGELRVLDWESGDVDLEHGTIHIHRAWDRRAKGVTSTKSGRSRRFNIEPTLLPLLRELFNRAGGKGSVVALPSERDMARGLRRWLTKAGLTRSELHTSTRTTRAIRFHDLRATGLTWMAVRGDEPLKIMQRAGHTNFATTQLYVRTAEAIRDGFGEVFPPLPVDLLGPEENDPTGEAAGGVFPPGVSTRDLTTRNYAGRTGLESASDVEKRQATADIDVSPDCRSAEGSRSPEDASTRRDVADREVETTGGSTDRLLAELLAELRAMRSERDELRAEVKALRREAAGVADLESRRKAKGKR